MTSLSESGLLLLKYGKIKLFVRKSEPFVFYATFIAGEYDKLSVEKGSVVLDFGANVGDYTIKAASLVGKSGKVIAVEPDPKNMEILKLNLKINGIENVIAVNAAISDEEGEAYLAGKGTRAYISDKRISSEDLPIKLITIGEVIDKYVKGEDVIIKMDIEGAEGLVFKKSNFLTRVNQISMELHGLENINVVNNVLNSSGFKVQRYGVTDELNSTLKNILKHPVDFLMNERKSGYIAIKGVNSIIKHKRNPVPSLSENEFELITAKRIY